MRMNEISVFGGTNMDVLGSPSQEMNLRDSNLGHVQLQVGGVGHNIAARIAAHNISCVLFTAIGNDCLSDVIRIDCEKDNIDISHALKTDGRCCIYLAVHDSDGDMLVALNDMEAASYMDSGYVQRILPLINESRLCVIDTNPPAESIAYLAENARTAFYRLRLDGLDRVYDYQIRLCLFYLGIDMFQGCFCKDKQIVRWGTGIGFRESVGPQLYLSGTLLSTHIQHLLICQA